MQPICRQCNTALNPEDVDIDSLSAHCRHCGWTLGGASSPYRQAAAPLVTMADASDDAEMAAADASEDGEMDASEGGEVAADASEDGESAVAEAPAQVWQGPADLVEPLPPVPPGISVEERGGRLMLARTWRSWYGAAGAAMMAIGPIVIAIYEGSPLSHAMPALFLGVWCFGWSYWCAMVLFNTTYIEVSAATLRVRHGPIFWPGKSLRSRDVEQLYVDDEVPRDDISFGRGFQLHSGPRILRRREARYRLSARRRDGKTVTLVRLMRSPQQAFYMEAAVQKHLGLVNLPIDEELSRVERLMLTQKMDELGGSSPWWRGPRQ